AFAMVSAYLLSLSLVPVRCAAWLRATPGSQAPYDAPAPCGDPRHDDDLLYHAVDLDRLAAPKRKSFTDVWTAWYLRRLAAVMAHRRLTVAIATLLLVAVVGGLGPQLRREFFPEVDGATFEAYVRAPTGTRIDTLRGAEAKVARIEGFFREQLGDDIEIMISEIGVTPDWSAAYTPNSGPMDAVIKVQLTENRRRTAQQCVALIRRRLDGDDRLADLDLAFDAGGVIRGAMNERRSTPINIRIEAKDLDKAHRIAER